MSRPLIKNKLKYFILDFQHLVIRFPNKDERETEARIIINTYYQDIAYECISWLNNNTPIDL